MDSFMLLGEGGKDKPMRGKKIDFIYFLESHLVDTGSPQTHASYVAGINPRRRKGHAEQ